MKALGYIRVSTSEQAIDGISIDNQVAKIHAYAAYIGIEPLEIIIDAGKSAKSLDRPGIQKVIASCQAGEVSHVIVYKLDRLTRRTRDLLTLVEDVFQKNDVQFHSLNEKIDTSTAMGKFFLTIMGAMAQMEREQISERTKDAMQYMKAQGQHIGAPGLGFRMKNGQAVEDPEEMTTLRYILDLKSQGLTLQGIADRLNTEGRKTKRGGKWHPSTVDYILRKAAV